MRIKMIFASLLILPIWVMPQIRFIDTVSVSGYFFEIVSKYHKIYRKSTGYLSPYFDFVPSTTLHQRSFKAHLQKVNYEEKDTVKFLSCQVHEELGAYETADESVRPWIGKVKDIEPFYVGQKSSPSGIKDHFVIISYVNIQWLHLRMRGTVACDGFNLPITFDCWEKSKTHDYDVYLPLKLLSMEQGIKLKNGNPVHPKKASNSRSQNAPDRRLPK